MDEELTLTIEEVKILRKYMDERQGGCFYIGEITAIISKINDFLNDNNVESLDD